LKLIKFVPLIKRFVSGSPFLKSLYLKSRYATYFLFLGNNFECVFCRKRFRKLLSSGLKQPVLIEKKVISGGYRPNCICPFCGSSDRSRHVYLYLKNKTNIFHEKVKILHVAPELELKKAFLSNPKINYVSVDIEPNLAMIQMDITNIQFEDNEFDVIICNHVLEHIPNDRKAISELFRVMRKGGFAILQIPISFSIEKTLEDPTADTPELREKTFGQQDHVRIYGRDYLKRLSDAGFLVKLYSFAEENGSSEAQKLGLITDEKVFICSSKNN